MDIKNMKRFFVLGLGKSGTEVAALLISKGFEVSVADDDYNKTNEWMQAWPGSKQDMRINAYSLEEFIEKLKRADCLVLSPGVPLAHPAVAAARGGGIEVAGELEVAYSFCTATIIGITGTNGKSTVTDLLGKILERSGIKSVTAGNIGTPFSSVVRGEEKFEVAVLEISSFQLDTIDEFRADIATLLNVTPDHLDRYNNSFDEYAESKRRILNRADEDSIFIFNENDDICKSSASNAPSRLIPFSREAIDGDGIFLEKNIIMRRWENRSEAIIRRDDFMPIGIHNIENALAAVGAATALGVEREPINAAMREYRPLPHRMELVRVAGGVAYINDSKATNIDAAAKSIKSIEGQIVLIIGGRDKNNDFSVLKSVLGGVKHMILIGETARIIETILSASAECTYAKSMEEAVEKARTIAEAGDTILLAPACASFDMFRDYKERGDCFKNAVNAL